MSSYVQALVELIHKAIEDPSERDPTKSAVPYYVLAPSNEQSGRVASFPNLPGVYAIVRYFNVKGRVRPRILYVGIAHSQSIRKRLANHFVRKSNPSEYGGSRFANAMWEIVQADEEVFRILSSPSTCIAAVPIPNRSKEYIEAVETLCIQALNPLLNIRE
jgi:hypothetical protein